MEFDYLCKWWGKNSTQRLIHDIMFMFIRVTVPTSYYILIAGVTQIIANYWNILQNKQHLVMKVNTENFLLNWWPKLLKLSTKTNIPLWILCNSMYDVILRICYNFRDIQMLWYFCEKNYCMLLMSTDQIVDPKN